MKLCLEGLPPGAAGELGPSSSAGASGWCRCEALEAAYGLRQGGCLALKKLGKALSKEGCLQPKRAPVLRLCKARHMPLALAMGGFGASLAKSILLKP